MKILSPCDGISCGRVELERAGIAVERYVALEHNRTERADSTMAEHGCGVSTVRLATGAMFDSGVSTSLDVELILRSND